MVTQSDLAPVAAPALDDAQAAHAAHNIATLAAIRPLLDRRSPSAYQQLVTLIRVAASMSLDVYCYLPVGAADMDPNDPAAWVIWVDQEWPDVDGRTRLSTYLDATPLGREAAMKAQIVAWRRLIARRASRREGGAL